MVQKALFPNVFPEVGDPDSEFAPQRIYNAQFSSCSHFIAVQDPDQQTLEMDAEKKTPSIRTFLFAL
jgi:hypothetical protein